MTNRGNTYRGFGGSRGFGRSRGFGWGKAFGVDVAVVFALVLVTVVTSASCSGRKRAAPHTKEAQPSVQAVLPATPVQPNIENNPDALEKKAIEPETIEFPSLDGLIVTANLYVSHPDDAPFVVLFHQAGWSRGEYFEIAPRLANLGFNCMAVDQRSGNEVGGVKNETVARAVEAKLDTGYPSALPDIEAALAYVQERWPKAKRIAWGSSYSSSLALVLAGSHPELVDAVVSFSPGEYFARFGESKTYVRDAAASIKQPVFITSAKKEEKQWEKIFAAIPSNSKTSFLPNSDGNHGSRALWKKYSDSPAYWTAVQAFLLSLK